MVLATTLDISSVIKKSGWHASRFLEGGINTMYFFVMPIISSIDCSYPDEMSGAGFAKVGAWIAASTILLSVPFAAISGYLTAQNPYEFEKVISTPLITKSNTTIENNTQNRCGLFGSCLSGVSSSAGALKEGVISLASSTKNIFNNYARI